MSVELHPFILPIFIVKENKSMPNAAPFTLEEFCGTGFIMAPKLLITCWHCLKNVLPSDYHYGVGMKKPDGKYGLILLENIEQDRNGTDLATSNLAYNSETPLKLSKSEILMANDIWTYGYPLTDKRTNESGFNDFQLNGRFMKGYVTRSFFFRNSKEYKEIKSYELNFIVPEGISGAPLIKQDTMEVVGVIYGVNEVAVIDQFASIDAKTGERKPEIQRLMQFGLAHYTETLHNLSGKATGGKLLKEFIGVAM